MNDGKFRAVDGLDLAEDDTLPWLESDEEEVRPGGVDKAQLISFVGFLLVVGIAVVGLVWYFSNASEGPAQIADGSTIAAPEEPYKEPPENAGGKEFAGTGDVAPAVGQGEAPDAQIANAQAADAGTGASASGASDGSTQGATSAVGSKIVPVAEPSSAPVQAPPPPSANTNGVAVQLAAYSTRSRAEQGWRELRSQTRTLAGIDRRIVEGLSDGNTVFRLQAVMGTLAEANALCRTLKSEGLDCQVKR